MSEVKIKKPTPEKQELAKYPTFELPLFRGSLFNLNPFSLIRRFTEDMDRYFGTAPWIEEAEVLAKLPNATNELRRI